MERNYFKRKMSFKEYLKKKKKQMDKYAEKRDQKKMAREKQHRIQTKLDAEYSRKELKELKAIAKDEKSIKQLKDYKKKKRQKKFENISQGFGISEGTFGSDLFGSPKKGKKRKQKSIFDI